MRIEQGREHIGVGFHVVNDFVDQNLHIIFPPNYVFDDDGLLDLLLLLLDCNRDNFLRH